MKEPLYRQAIQHSWELAWQHKLLWGFGLFAAFLGQMGILEFLMKVGKASSTYALYPTWLALPKLFKYSGGWEAMSLPADMWLWLIFLLVVLFGFVAFLIFMAVVSQGAIIQVAAKSVKNKSKVLPDTGLAWQAGVSHFWRLFLINFIKKAIIVVLAVVVGWATLNVVVEYSVLDMLIFFVVFLLACVVGFSLSFLTVYAAGYVVVEEYKLWKAVKSAWRLFLDHWLVSIEVGLIILFLNIILTVVALIGFLVLFFPTLIIWFISIVVANTALYIAGIIVGLILYTVFLVFIGSVFTVFTTSVWTYLFMKMHKHGIISRILHVFK